MPLKNKETRKEYQRAYHKQYDADYYEKNKDKIKEQKKERRRQLREWFLSILAELKCKCGESHWSCLEFHHRDPNEKEFAISDMYKCGFSRERILAEIRKCDVMCANCHRKLHFP